MSDHRLDPIRAKLVRLLREYGEHAMSEWLTEILVEAGLLPVPLPLAG
jgi:hypothetical protein